MALNILWVTTVAHCLPGYQLRQPLLGNARPQAVWFRRMPSNNMGGGSELLTEQYWSAWPGSSPSLRAEDKVGISHWLPAG